MPQQTENFIKLDSVHFTYRTDEEQNQEVLDDITLNIEQGDFVAVLGHNGSGKSTLAKLFNALLEPESGKVYVNGMDSSAEENKLKIRQIVGMVFQNPDNQLVATVVEEDVAFGPENLGIEPDEIRRRVDESLKAVDMYKYKDHAPHKLSGGQKQRVAIAGVIAMRSRCIVLDEPTAMLDPHGRKEVMSIIKKLNREHGITVIYITHYMDEAAQADRIVVMNRGKILMDAAPKEVFAQVEALKEVGLDVPQTTQLAYELRREGIALPQDILSEGECVENLCKLMEESYCQS